MSKGTGVETNAFAVIDQGAASLVMSAEVPENRCASCIAAPGVTFNEAFLTMANGCIPAAVERNEQDLSAKETHDPDR